MAGGAGSPGERVRVRAVVSGRVQGVWFRESCRIQADQLAVAGSVRNLPDGRVEIEAEGARAAVGSLLRWARTGPPRARVTGLAVEDLPPTGEPGFRVTR